MAALAAGLADGAARPELVREAVALSAAAVPCPVVGEVDTDLYRNIRTSTAVEKIHAPHGN